MRGIFGIVLLLLALSAQSESAQPDSAGEQHLNSTPAWLEGCWITPDGMTSERWTAVSNDYLFGLNVTVTGGQVGFFEQLRIEPGEAGPTFQAYPRGVGPVGFAMASSAEQAISFIRPEHDYPQRISYSRVGDVLTATVSLLDGSRPNSWLYGLCE
jgi:hypothetical protein